MRAELKAPSLGRAVCAVALAPYRAAARVACAWRGHVPGATAWMQAIVAVLLDLLLLVAVTCALILLAVRDRPAPTR